jgi:hypothetical protein
MHCALLVQRTVLVARDVIKLFWFSASNRRRCKHVTWRATRVLFANILKVSTAGGSALNESAEDWYYLDWTHSAHYIYYQFGCCAAASAIPWFQFS